MEGDSQLVDGQVGDSLSLPLPEQIIADLVIPPTGLITSPSAEVVEFAGLLDESPSRRLMMAQLW